MAHHRSEAAVFAITAVWTLAGSYGSGKAAVQHRHDPARTGRGLVRHPDCRRNHGLCLAHQCGMLYWGCNAATFFVALQIFASRTDRGLAASRPHVFRPCHDIVGPLQELYGGGEVLWLFEPFPRFVPQFGPFPYGTSTPRLSNCFCPLHCSAPSPRNGGEVSMS